MKMPAVDLALILAVDVSSSIDGGDYHLQMFGIAHALRDDDVVAAIRAGKIGAIALSIIQWSSNVSQSISLDWSIIGNAADAGSVADEVERINRQWIPGGTGLAMAIEASRHHFQSLPWPTNHRVIDISGDGQDNEGGDVNAARDNAVAENVTINGLPIISGSPTIEAYYSRVVIGGPNCFYIPATNINAFREAMTRKLLREVQPIAA